MIGWCTSPVTIRQEWNAGRTQPWISLGKRVYTVSSPQQICPRRKENYARRHRHLFIPQCLQKGQRESTAGRLAAYNDLVGSVALNQQKPVGSACV